MIQVANATPASMLLGVLLAATLPAIAVAAQDRSGVVVTADSTPIVGALVSLWSAGRVFSTVPTDTRGRFSFALAEAAQASSISARAIGYSPMSAPLDSRTSWPRVLVLAPQPPILPAIVADESPFVCPTRNDVAATSLWEATRRRYSIPSYDAGIGIEGYYRAADVSENEFGMPTDASFREHLWWQAYPGNIRRLVAQWIVDSGYAFRRLPDPSHFMVANQAYLNWWYPRLDRWDADHFGRPLFGAMNNLRIVRSSPAGWTIAFCTNRRYKQRIIGELQITSDSTFHSARWQFQTPRPRENAWGEVTFVAASRGPLTPLESLFARRKPGKGSLFYQEAAIIVKAFPFDGKVGP
ncbi:MAG: carboxypeptidase-like regulatory domain-containing protein [Gemmatimonadales bacterium]